MSSNRLVIYHDNCWDGFGAAWAARHYWPDAVFHPASYGQEPPDVTGKDVIVADFTYTRNGTSDPSLLMDTMAATAKSLRVFDHHKTAAEALKDKPYAIFDMRRSGAVITWQALMDAPLPKLLEYVQDRDLWKWELPDSKEISAWIASHLKDFDTWTMMAESLQRHWSEAVIEGKAILRFQDQKVLEICNNATLGTIGTDDHWWMVPIVNTPCFQSEVGHYLNEAYPNQAFSAYYFDRADGFRQYGLRSIGDFDVSAVAKLLGGGGHKNAAGFQVKL